MDFWSKVIIVLSFISVVILCMGYTRFAVLDLAKILNKRIRTLETSVEGKTESLAMVIEETLASHLPMKPRPNGSVPCECLKDGTSSYNDHLTQVLTEAILKAGYRQN